MSAANVVQQTNLPRLWRRGKVRDIYDLGERLLIVATDRISVFDVVLPTPIPDKGRVLNLLSAHWFERSRRIIPNHLLAVVTSLDMLKSHWPTPLPEGAEMLLHRSMVTAKAEPVPVECVVRGYLTGSAWDEYSRQGTINQAPQTPGLLRNSRLPRPLFTPTTKAPQGEHDLPLTVPELEKLAGQGLARALEEQSLAVFAALSEECRSQGIIVADSKLEFGLLKGQLILIDEVFTPDSSRFWDAASWAPGKEVESLDKQPVRDFLASTSWDRRPPGPPLPDSVVQQTTARYRDVYRRLTGQPLPDC
ncbi:MAG: phosphoribosylaminoimidazolesuccinocarboxamide synthase [Chloroflexi bacterium]|nr:phosphoribosylaminoimidazolesuccinocarboxamide synthase [Chloroflexota bacterium]